MGIFGLGSKAAAETSKTVKALSGIGHGLTSTALWTGGGALGGLAIAGAANSSGEEKMSYGKAALIGAGVGLGFRGARGLARMSSSAGAGKLISEGVGKAGGWAKSGWGGVKKGYNGMNSFFDGLDRSSSAFVGGFAGGLGGDKRLASKAYNAAFSRRGLGNAAFYAPAIGLGAGLAGAGLANAFGDEDHSYAKWGMAGLGLGVGARLGMGAFNLHKLAGANGGYKAFTKKAFGSAGYDIGSGILSGSWARAKSSAKGMWGKATNGSTYTNAYNSVADTIGNAKNFQGTHGWKGLGGAAMGALSSPSKEGMKTMMKRAAIGAGVGGGSAVIQNMWSDDNNASVFGRAFAGALAGAATYAGPRYVKRFNNGIKPKANYSGLKSKGFEGYI